MARANPVPPGAPTGAVAVKVCRGPLCGPKGHVRPVTAFGPQAGRVRSVCNRCHRHKEKMRLREKAEERRTTQERRIGEGYQRSVRTCQECGFTGPWTRELFAVERGGLIGTCRGCAMDDAGLTPVEVGERDLVRLRRQRGMRTLAAVLEARGLTYAAYVALRGEARAAVEDAWTEAMRADARAGMQETPQRIEGEAYRAEWDAPDRRPLRAHEAGTPAEHAARRKAA